MTSKQTDSRKVALITGVTGQDGAYLAEFLLIADVGFKPATEVEDGLERFVRWYRDYQG